ncbi:chondrolectin [Scyliorhinus canicula]|uniref:chondrolectin n=1 Tax=Scyliorhinus canicula TaxID=7830 RepID=UPI0018F27A42|nr:chondrolectin [Scyliorhinus canicula]
MLLSRALSSRMVVLILSGILASGSGTRVLSGQTVCYGGPEFPCYKIAYFQDLSRRIGFEEASQACEMDGGALVSIRSTTEQGLIESLLQDLTKSGSGLSDGDFWIGLRRSGEGQSPNTFSGCPDLYRWTDGNAAKFRNWYTDEPSCGSEACVVMYHQLTAQPGLGGPYLYQWNDDRCNMKHNFICKYSSAARVGFEPQSPEHKSGLPASDCATISPSVNQASDNLSYVTELEGFVSNESADRVEPDYVSENVSTQPEVKIHAPSNSADDQHHMVVTESSGMMPNVVYVIIPTIPLLLLLVVALATCCIQMLSRSKVRSKSSPNESTLWISPNPKKENLANV